MSEQSQTPAGETQQPVTQAAGTEGSNVAPQAQVNEVKFIVGNDGKFAQGFESMLPEDIRGHSILKKYDNISDLLKSKINSDGLIGKRVSEYLDSKDPAVVAERNKHFGIPEKADGYTIKLNLPEGVASDDQRIGAFREFAHKIGLPDKYASDLAQYQADLYLAQAKAGAEADIAEKDDAEKALREAWKGEAYDKNIRSVHLLLTKQFGLTEEELSKPVGNNPALLKALISKVVPAFGEDALIQGGMTQTFATSEQKLDDLNKKMISMNPNTPEYGALVREKKAILASLK